MPCRISGKAQLEAWPAERIYTAGSSEKLGGVRVVTTIYILSVLRADYARLRVLNDSSTTEYSPSSTPEVSIKTYVAPACSSNVTKVSCSDAWRKFMARVVPMKSSE